MERSGTRRLLGVGAMLVAVALATGVALATNNGGDRSNDVKRAIEGGKARSVILLIGDGMGDSEITIARNYQVGANGRLAMDTLPLTGEYTTYAVAKGRPHDARLRHRLRRLRHGVGDRAKTYNNRSRPADRGAEDDPRAGEARG